MASSHSRHARRTLIARPYGRREARVNLRGVARVPAAPLLADLAVLLQAGEDAVEVVLLDAHLVGELRDGDPGVRADELERLLAARARAARAAASTGAPAGAR